MRYISCLFYDIKKGGIWQRLGLNIYIRINMYCHSFTMFEDGV